MNAINQPKEEEPDEEELKRRARIKKRNRAKGIEDESSDEDEKKFQMQNSVQCPDEIFHYMRCIPYVENTLQNIWGSPDFLLSAKKGGTFEHCLLMCSLFHGCLNENYPTYKDKTVKASKKVSVVNMTKREQLTAKFDAWDPIGLEHRTFVCIGVLKNTEQLHSWVMTFDRDFKVVTFWECRNGLKYVLRHRVKDEEVGPLRSYLCPQSDIYESSRAKAFYDLENTGVEKMKKQYNNCKRAFKRRLRECMASIKSFIIQEDNFNDTDQQQEELRQKQEEIVEELEKENQEEDELLLDEEENQGTKKNKETVLGFTSFDQLMANAKEKAMVFRNRDEEKGDKKMLTRDQIMEEKKRMYEEQQAKRKDRHLLPVQFFEFDENGNGIPDDLTVPYESIDLVFNNKNIYMNIKNHDPLRIYYHLHRTDEWMPFLKHQMERSQKRELNEQQKLQLQELDEDDEEGRRAIEWEDWVETVYYRDAIDPFYRTKNVSAPSKLEEVEKLENEINKYIKKTIMQIRSALNLQTKYRQTGDLITQLMANYLKELENYQCARQNEEYFQQKREKFINNIKYFLDIDYMVECQPFFFNTTNQETIKQILQEDPPSFFTIKEKKSIFATAVQIFPYAQKIFSVRIMIAIFYVKKKEIEQVKAKTDNPAKKEEQEEIEEAKEEDEEEK